MCKNSGRINKVLLFKNSEQVGYGFIIIRSDGKILEPMLFGNDGERYPNNELLELIVTSEEHLVVLTERKQ